MSDAPTVTDMHQVRMIETIRQLAPTEGYTRSILDGLTLMRSNRPLESPLRRKESAVTDRTESLIRKLNRHVHVTQRF